MTEQTTEILKAYKEGFKDGYNEAVKFYITNQKINTRPVNYPIDYDGCPVCGRKGPDAMVCSHPRCPSRITVKSYLDTYDPWVIDPLSGTVPL